MLARRRIDWSEIVSAGPDTPVPVWTENRAPSALIARLLAFEELFSIDDPDALCARAVALALDPVGLVRAGIYLYDEPLGLMLGTWGTNLARQVVDEHHAMFKLDAAGRRVFERAAAGEAHWTVVQDCPIIVNDEPVTRIVGRGWAVCTPIRSARGPVGMLYNDAGLTGARVDTDQQLNAALLCAIVGMRLEGLRRSRGVATVAKLLARHPVATRAAQLLERHPSWTGSALARELGVSISRLARLFKAEMGLSLVAHRNRLRVQRFIELVDGGETNLLAAARAAGFGSYAQFYRVFQARQGKAPSRYVLARRRAV